MLLGAVWGRTASLPEEAHRLNLENAGKHFGYVSKLKDVKDISKLSGTLGGPCLLCCASRRHPCTARLRSRDTGRPQATSGEHT